MLMTTYVVLLTEPSECRKGNIAVLVTSIMSNSIPIDCPFQAGRRILEHGV